MIPLQVTGTRLVTTLKHLILLTLKTDSLKNGNLTTSGLSKLTLTGGNSVFGSGLPIQNFKTIDNDSIINPILVYGTEGKNGYDDGRIIIIIHYNDQIIAIRHQNGVLDIDRNTKVDSLFYYLPVELQNEVKSIMEEMEENNHAIFPYGWQDAMNRKEIYFDEN